MRLGAAVGGGFLRVRGPLGHQRGLARMTRSLRLVGLLVGGAAAAGVLVCSAAGAGAAEGSLATGTRYYMALGGSLTVNGGGAGNGQAYDNDLGAYYGAATIPGLQTVSFGCPGETTTTFISGKGNCSYPPQGSQLAAAEAFLRPMSVRSASSPSTLAATTSSGASPMRSRPFRPTWPRSAPRCVRPPGHRCRSPG